jgi:phosphoglycerate dehydrogenase-like enzyme
MPKIKLLVIAPPEFVSRYLSPIAELADIQASSVQAELEVLAAKAEVILWSSTAASINLREIWRQSKAVKWLHSLSAGIDKLLFPELINSAVVITNARGVYKRSLAEFALLGVLFHLKQTRRMIESQRTARWDSFGVHLAEGRTLGIVGYGEIGRECAKLAKAFGLRTHALRRSIEKSMDDPYIDRMFKPDDLHAMLKASDVVVCAAPLTRETHHMISSAEFAVMKPTAILVNIGRGPVVDESALVTALREGSIGAAALDVFEHEPLSAESPLWSMSNVLISPHCADRTIDPDWMDLSSQLFMENFHRYAKGEQLVNIVDKAAGY